MKKEIGYCKVNDKIFENKFDACLESQKSIGGFIFNISKIYRLQ